MNQDITIIILTHKSKDLVIDYIKDIYKKFKIIIVDNSNFEIIPGQLMTVKIIYDEIQQIGVPESAVTIQGDTAFVYTVTDDAAKKQNIKIGKRNFGKVSAISGLNEGDIVIVEGVSKVRDKAKVKIVTPAK